MGRSYSQILETQRLAEQSAKTERLRAARLAAEALDPALAELHKPVSRSTTRVAVFGSAYGAPKDGRTSRMSSDKSWIDGVLDCILDQGDAYFTLAEFTERYAEDLQEAHPGCVALDAAIRDTLQELRDRDKLVFVDNKGTYFYPPLEKRTLQ